MEQFGKISLYNCSNKDKKSRNLSLVGNWVIYFSAVHILFNGCCYKARPSAELSVWAVEETGEEENSDYFRTE